MNLFFCQVKEESQRLANQGFRAVFSCSGHLDSTVLLDVICPILQNSGLRSVEILHFNFKLRGDESDQNEEFIRDVAKSMKLKIKVVDVEKESKKFCRKNQSIQMWAREVREFHYRQYIDRGYVVIMGHHQNDRAETALFRLIRGSSSYRLDGMARLAQGKWRPLLNLNQAEVKALGKLHRTVHQDDSSNATLTYSRNILRHRVMPVLNDLFANADRRIVATAVEAKSIGDFAKSMIMKNVHGVDDEVTFEKKDLPHMDLNVWSLVLETMYNELAKQLDGQRSGQGARLSREELNKIALNAQKPVRTKSSLLGRLSPHIEVRRIGPRIMMRQIAVQMQKRPRFEQVRPRLEALCAGGGGMKVEDPDQTAPSISKSRTKK
jgi:tRNA(Ile)-lysidine synthetase-like protein